MTKRKIDTKSKVPNEKSQKAKAFTDTLLDVIGETDNEPTEKKKGVFRSVGRGIGYVVGFNAYKTFAKRNVNVVKKSMLLSKRPFENTKSDLSSAKKKYLVSNENSKSIWARYLNDEFTDQNLIAIAENSIKSALNWKYAFFVCVGLGIIQHLTIGTSDTAKINYFVFSMLLWLFWGSAQQAYLQLTRNKNIPIAHIFLRAIFKGERDLLKSDPDLAIAVLQQYETRKQEILAARKEKRRAEGRAARKTSPKRSKTQVCDMEVTHG